MSSRLLSRNCGALCGPSTAEANGEIRLTTRLIRRHPGGSRLYLSGPRVLFFVVGPPFDEVHGGIFDIALCDRVLSKQIPVHQPG